MEFEPGTPALFEEFLSELQALDDFRREYAERYDFQGLGRDDQDVQRLVEAMAFYRARTRASVQQGILQYKLQALEQLFPYLLSPLPAMALLHPVLASNVTDTRVLPGHAEVVVSPPAAPTEAARARCFRTCRDLAVYPLRIVTGSVRLRRRQPGEPRSAGLAMGEAVELPWTLSLDIAPSPTGAESKRYFDDPKCGLRELCLYVNPSGDVLSALRSFDALQQSCRRVTAIFFAEGAERYQTSSRPQFGPPAATQSSSWENPIESARRVVHFPLAQLCLRVPLVGAPSEWTRLSLSFQLDESWPGSASVSDQSFLLNAVPVENLLRRSAEPVQSDGTSVRSRVQAPEETMHLRAREIMGVYRSDPNAPGVREALFPRALVDEGYSVTARGSGVEREVWLETELVLGSVGAPVKIYVDAEWYDPDGRLPSPREATVRADAHDLGALVWRLADPLVRPHDSPLMGDAALLDRLLELQGKPPRSPRDLKLLFKVIGVDESDVFGRVPRHLESVTVGWVPDARSSSGGLRNYDIVLGNLPRVLLPGARLLFASLPSVLATWCGDAEVRVSVVFDAGSRERPVVFEWKSLGQG